MQQVLELERSRALIAELTNRLEQVSDELRQSNAANAELANKLEQIGQERRAEILRLAAEEVGEEEEEEESVPLPLP